MINYQSIKDHLELMIQEYRKDEKFYKMAMQRGQPLKDCPLIVQLCDTVAIQYRLELEYLEDMDKNENYKYLHLFIDFKTFEGGSQKRNIYTYLQCIVRGEENKGLQRKSFAVIFDKGLDTQNFKNDGLLLIDLSIVKIPTIWDCQKDSNGKTRYPYIYITEYIKYYQDNINIDYAR